MSSLLQLYMPLTNPETEQAPHKVPCQLYAAEKGCYEVRADASELCNLPLLPTARATHTKTLQSTQVAVAGVSRVHGQWDFSKDSTDQC